MPLLIVSHRLASSPFQRQSGLGSGQRLHLALLVHTHHECVFGRAEVPSYDRFKFLGKMRVIADLERRGQMGIEPWSWQMRRTLVRSMPTLFATLRLLQ